MIRAFFFSSTLLADATSTRTATHLRNSLDFFIDKLPHSADLTASLLALGILILICSAVWLFVSRILLRVVSKLILRTQTRWDDVLESSGVFKSIAPLPALIVFYSGVAAVPLFDPPWDQLLQRLTLVAIVLVISRTVSAGFGAVNAIYSLYDVSRGRPIKGFVQVLQVTTYFLAGIFVLSILMDRSPIVFFTGLGAMTAVLMLVFRDTILSLVAGVQLTSTNQIRVGDWIEMPNFGADGTVMDIALNTVAVQNFDRTITVIPAHKFLENSFKNWRNVFDTDARRIKRHLLIDIDSVRFLDEGEFEKLAKIRILAPYLQLRKEEIESYNQQLIGEGVHADIVNLRSMTNFGTFRAYANSYLQAHPKLRGDLSMMVRHLQPSPEGIPLEIYCFSNETTWTIYEGIQADIFEHLISVMPYFGLRAFQAPSGLDVKSLGTAPPPSKTATNHPPAAPPRGRQ